MSWTYGSIRSRARYALATALTLLAIMASFAASASPVSAATTITFSGPELLGKPTDTSVAINIVPDAGITYYYEYGTASGTYTAQTTTTTASASRPSEMTLSGLTPNTKYYYRMKYHISGETDWVTRTEYSFWTQRPAGSSFTFTITSDGHAVTTSAHTQAWQNVKSDHPDFDIDLGDAFILGGTTSQSAVNTKYLAQRSVSYFGAASHSAALFLAAGNHEDEEGWNLDDTPFSIGVASIQARKWYYPTPVSGSFYSGNTDMLAAINEATYGNELREDYYAWQWGDVLFVVIDPFQYTMNLPYTGGAAGEGTDDPKTGDQWSWTLGARQYGWLKQTLEGSTAHYKFVFSHHMTGGIPRGVDGGEAGYVRGGAEAAGYFEWGGKNADGTDGFASHRNLTEFPMPIHQLFLTNGVNAYFHGHDHQFAYETRDGIVYQEVPSPSMTWTDFPNVYAEGDHGSYNTIKVLSNTGHLRVQVTPSQATVTYVKSNSGSGYSYAILPPTTYTLTTAANPSAGGTLIPVAGTHTYAPNTDVTVTAMPAAGYRFDHWSGDCSGTGACSVTMTANKSVTAHFALNEYALTVTTVGQGSVTKLPDQTAYHYGDIVQLTANAAAGWQFSAWSGALTGAANPASVTVAGDTSVTATFVDALPPETTIDTGPSGPTSSPTASFTFSSDDPASTFQCRLDGAAFAPCVSPAAYTALSDGEHTFQARALDQAGNIDPTPAARMWTVDTTPPALDITGATADGAAMSGTPATGYILEIAGDPAFDRLIQFAEDTSASEPLQAEYFGLYLTASTVSADALKAYYDARGVPEPYLGYLKAATDGVKPFVYIHGSTITLVDAARHDLAPVDVAMTVPDNYPLGNYTVSGNILDLAGNPQAVTLKLVVAADVTAPETTLITHPSELTNSDAAAFSFSSSEGRASFACALDGATFAPCASPVEYTGLTDDAHQFSVAATDAAGNTDLSPAAFAWTVDTVPPDTTLDIHPTEPTNSPDAAFAFSSEPAATFECALDGAAFAACASPVDYTGLADGPHQFSVAATDAAGNSDPTPATFAWTIDTSPFTLDALTLRQSPDQIDWTPVHGDFAAGYTVSLDPAAEWRYLDVAALTASHTLRDGAYPFILDQTALPAGWLAYWAAKGVTANAPEPWQQQMWAIIHGDAPIFFLRSDQDGYMLVDGLLRALGQPDAFLRVNGDYPPGPYSYAGSLTDRYGAILPVTARLTFIGPAVPAAPVVTVAASGSAVHLSWPAVVTDATGRFTVVTTYQVFRSPTPFFAPGPDTLRAEPAAPEYADATASGGISFYLVRAANIVGPSADSNQTAVFTFALTPGAMDGQMRAD